MEWYYFLLFAVGIVLIAKGGDLFVDSAAYIADVSGIPKFIVGATIVSFATTLPEMLVSALAAGQGKTEMAIGNAVGSVTANTGLIMALSMLLVPMAVVRRTTLPKAVLLIAAVLGLWGLSIGGLTVWKGLLLFVIFAVFVAENILSAKKQQGNQEERVTATRKAVVKSVVILLLSATAIVAGSDLLVHYGSLIAAGFGVPESVIGLTAIAIGTSLPELVTAVTAILKKQADLSVGNVIGANIIDTTMILPVCAVISGGTLPVTTQTLWLDLPVCLGVILLALLPALFSGRFRRWQGVACLTVYAGYLAYVFIGCPGLPV